MSNETPTPAAPASEASFPEADPARAPAIPEAVLQEAQRQAVERQRRVIAAAQAAATTAAAEVSAETPAVTAAAAPSVATASEASFPEVALAVHTVPAPAGRPSVTAAPLPAPVKDMAAATVPVPAVAPGSPVTVYVRATNTPGRHDAHKSDGTVLASDSTDAYLDAIAALKAEGLDPATYVRLISPSGNAFYSGRLGEMA